MSVFFVVSRCGELFPGVPQGKISQAFPWGIPYLFSYENKARNRSNGLRARYRAHVKFARALGASATSLIGGVNP